MSLTDKQKADYERDGFVIYGPLLSEETLQALRERMDALADGFTSQCGKGGGYGWKLPPREVNLRMCLAVTRFGNSWIPHRYDEAVFDHASNPKILDIVSELLGTEDIKTIPHPDLDEALPSTVRLFSWHQDSAYWDFRRSPYTRELLDSVGRCNGREWLSAVASRKL